MSFDQQAITDLYSAVVSAAQKNGAFASVVQHEPKSAPQSLPAVALWLAGLEPVAAVSGLAATSARVDLRARIYLNFASKPEEQLDLQLLALTSTLIGLYTSGFTLGGEDDVMFVDLLGAFGDSLSMRTAWLVQDSKTFRIAETTIPIILDDVWIQEA